MPPTPYSITTPIYYVNDKPHIGHCYTTTVADAAARLARLLGRDVFFLTGTDEHGQKVEKSAAARGVSPQALADENAVHFEAAMRLIGASNTDFIRTTQPRHTRQVQAVIKRLIDSGDIYLGTFEGWYDEGQEEYVTENAAREKNYTAFNGRPLVKAKEQNYYFKLSKWQPALEKFFDESPNFVRPAARFNEVRARLKDGLQDVPVSRTNFSWGIPIPGAPGHVTYVWIDALLNYTTALGVADPATAKELGVPGDRARYWPADVHAIGKEILWFHAVIWPALLMALELPTPGCIYAHSFWISEGKKMSKTLGNFIDLPLLRAYIDRFGLDALRWYLLTQGPLRETDADFSYAKFVEVYNADLANGIGNCASRVANMIEKYFGGKIPEIDRARTSTTGTDWTHYAVADGTVFDFRALSARALRQAQGEWEAMRLDEALMQGTALAGQIDLFINHTRPFSIAKEMDKAPERIAHLRDQLARILVLCAEGVRVASLFLYPAMPAKMAALWRTWNCSPLTDPNDPSSAFRAPLADLAIFGGPHALQAGHAIAKGEALFMRAKAEDPAPVAA
ncbi:MAG TPA: class I tRNA ligase family protein [Phycisphaerales bacterium]|nr:class I tRNA ligase family protein [Phycisphaerales bacterium]